MAFFDQTWGRIEASWPRSGSFSSYLLVLLVRHFFDFDGVRRLWLCFDYILVIFWWIWHNLHYFLNDFLLIQYQVFFILFSSFRLTPTYHCLILFGFIVYIYGLILSHHFLFHAQCSLFRNFKGSTVLQ